MFLNSQYLKAQRGIFCGSLAVLLWGLLAAFSRSLLEQLGMFTAGGCIYVLGGIVCFFLYPPKKGPFSVKYHVGCGLCAVAYFCLYSIGLGLAVNRIQAVEMGLINYLWPLLTLVFSVIFFPQKIVFPLMIAGILFAFTGFAVSSSALSGVPLTASALWQNFLSNPLPYLMMTGAAVSWALYSNILASVDRKTIPNGMPWFMIIGGLILWLMRYPFHEVSTWNLTVFWQLLFMAILPIGGGYFFWDKAMLSPKRDSAILISYLTPLCSSLGCAIFLKVHLPWSFYVACLLVIVGALLSRYAVTGTLHK